MARPTLQRNPKWRRLVQALGGDQALARGSLELLWDVAYEAGNEVIGDQVDVELAAGWRGTPGTLVKALLEAGGPGRPGFIAEVAEEPGRYLVHDLWDHAPDYVRKRRTREAERKEKGAALRSVTGQSPDTVGRAADIDRGAADGGGDRPPDGRPRAPAPAPAPTPEKPAAAARERAKPRRKGTAATASAAPPLAREAVSTDAPSTEAVPELPGAGGGDRTGPEEGAAQANAASGGESPAARDAGGAAPAGIAGGTGARGPARRGPVFEDEPPPRKLLCLDGAELGPLGAEFVGRVEVEIKRPLAPPKPEHRAKVRDELEQLLAARGDMDRCVTWATTTILGREGSGVTRVHSVTLCLAFLREMPTAKDPLAAVRAACPEFAAVLEELERRPQEFYLSPGVLDRWLATLRATYVAGELVLEAEDTYHRDLVEQMYLGGLQRLAVEVIAPHAVVTLAPAPAATQEA